jgi:hypothetical protein
MSREEAEAEAKAETEQEEKREQSLTERNGARRTGGWWLEAMP